ncbi:hypothetical protein VULLAG_LOCUS2236 [Vulpes lagopus]
MILEKKKKKVEETLLCYREARGSKPDPAKMSPLLASLSWQLLGAPPKAGSGKHKGSLCKTFSKKKKKGKNKCKCFPQPQRGGGQGTEQTPGRPGPYEGPLQRSFEPNWPVPEESEGEQEGESDAMAQFHAFHAGQHWVKLQYGVCCVYY